MSSVRMNVTLPKDINDTLKELSGPRGQSAFIAESIRFYAKRIKRQRMQAELKAQYQEASLEDLELIQDFDSTAADGLDDL